MRKSARALAFEVKDALDDSSAALVKALDADGARAIEIPVLTENDIPLHIVRVVSLSKPAEART